MKNIFSFIQLNLINKTLIVFFLFTGLYTAEAQKLEILFYPKSTNFAYGDSVKIDSILIRELANDGFGITPNNGVLIDNNRDTIFITPPEGFYFARHSPATVSWDPKEPTEEFNPNPTGVNDPHWRAHFARD